MRIFILYRKYMAIAHAESFSWFASDGTLEQKQLRLQLIFRLWVDIILAYIVTNTKILRA